jgi:hypothetical protein
MAGAREAGGACGGEEMEAGRRHEHQPCLSAAVHRLRDAGPFPMEIHQGTELIVMKLEYYDMVRIIFMDKRGHPEKVPHSKVGHSVGHWEGATLVVDTVKVSASTITNNGLNHSDNVT